MNRLLAGRQAPVCPRGVQGAPTPPPRPGRALSAVLSPRPPLVSGRPGLLGIRPLALPHLGHFLSFDISPVDPDK